MFDQNQIELSIQPVTEALSNLLKASFLSHELIVIGFSGGMDSSLLALAASQLQKQYNFLLLHVHHGLQDIADNWVEHCYTFAQQINLPLNIEYVDVAKGNLEAMARQARYSAFAQHSSKIIVAHHFNDQIENLMMSITRGAGIKSLLLEQEKYLSQFAITVYRPLLNFSRQQLCNIAIACNLSYIIDPMNQDVSYNRVWWREKLLELENQSPASLSAIGKSINNLQYESQLLQEYLSLDLKSLVNQLGLSLVKWKQLYQQQAHKALYLLRFWLAEQGCLLNQAQLEQVVEVIQAPMTNRSFFHLNQFASDWLITRYKSNLLVVDRNKIMSLTIIDRSNELLLLQGTSFMGRSTITQYQVQLPTDEQFQSVEIAYLSINSKQREKLGKASIAWWMRDLVPHCKISYKSGLSKYLLLFVDLKAIEIPLGN